MSQKWNLGDIVPSDRERKPVRPASAPRPSAGERPPVRPAARRDEGTARPVEPRRTSRRPRRRWLWVVVILIVASLVGAAFGVFFGGANVVVYPKVRGVNVDATLAASREAAADTLAYEILELTAEEESVVSATGQEEAREQASGTITIYNAYSQNSQRLITNTRFETADGLIFRITESVDVPGYTRDADGTVRPGTITATIYASETGERYNVQPQRLTIPGLSENAEQFRNTYAELNGPTAGGFEGLRYIVPEDELAETRATLQERLRETLLARLAAERPNGFILFEPSVVFSYETVSTTDAGNQQVALRERVTLHAPIFPAEEFASFLAERTLAGYEGESVRIEDPSSLRFAYATTTPTLATEPIDFTLSGTARIVWNYDAEQLRRDLRGVSKNGIPVVASGYPALDKINAVIKPFWKNNFPDDVEKITITERLE